VNQNASGAHLCKLSRKKERKKERKKKSPGKIVVSKQDNSWHQLLQIRLQFKLHLNEEIICMLGWQIYSYKIISSTEFFRGYLMINQTYLMTLNSNSRDIKAEK
jgi:hypothetical protein